MDGGLGAQQRPLASAPKARVCYICGRQYMLHSFEIHIKQCKELFIAREELKDPRDRKKVPEDPLEKLGLGGGGGTVSAQSSPMKKGHGGSNGGDATAGVDASQLSLDEINRLSNEAYNTEALSTCAFCGRTFLPEKLAIHNRSCTAENPARRVTDAVRKGLQPADVSAAGSGARPSTSSGIPASSSHSSSPAKQSRRPKAEVDESHGAEVSGEVNLRLENGELRGHMGGLAGRNIRASQKAGPSSPGPTPSLLGPVPDFASKEEGISFLCDRIETLEGMAGDIFRAIADMKQVISKLRDAP